MRDNRLRYALQTVSTLQRRDNSSPPAVSPASSITISVSAANPARRDIDCCQRIQIVARQTPAEIITTSRLKIQQCTAFNISSRHLNIRIRITPPAASAHLSSYLPHRPRPFHSAAPRERVERRLVDREKEKPTHPHKRCPASHSRDGTSQSTIATRPIPCSRCKYRAVIAILLNKQNPILRFGTA